MKLRRELLLLVLILFTSLFFRVYGLNWDQNQHLHPDERFLTMVTQAAKWPTSVTEYFQPNSSPLNPYNIGFSFFVYGTFPMKVVKLASEFLVFDKYDYNNITIVGRLVSALLDVSTTFLVFLIGKKVFSERLGLLAAFFYSLAVLPIQLSHFFAVDTFLVFFLVLSFYFLVGVMNYPNSPMNFVALGVAFGLALASKISALFFLGIILIGFSYLVLKKTKLEKMFLLFGFFFLSAYLSWRIADPRVFADANLSQFKINQQFVNNLKQLKSSSDENSLFPPAIQWIKTTPLVFPLKNMMLWGLGLPLGILTVLGVLYSLMSSMLFIVRVRKRFLYSLGKVTFKQLGHLLIVVWILFLFIFQGVQFVKALRYFYPIYPFLALVSAWFVYEVVWKRFKNRVVFGVLIIMIFVYPLSFLSIYSLPHSRVTASEWIYDNIPKGSTISCEHWDDCLPLPVNGKSSAFYKTVQLALFAPDTEEKWKKVNSQIEKIDYLILSSNRLWRSISRVPDRYPITSKFYGELLSGKLQFIKVAEIYSFPTIPFLNVALSDIEADESFTVYDHPQVIIFKKK